MEMELDISPSKPTLELLRNQDRGYTKDENGCIILISVLRERNAEMIGMMLGETINRIPKLMVHPIGSLFVCNLIEVCNGNQWANIFNRVIWNSRHLVSICYDNHGSNVVHKLLEKLTELLKLYPTETERLYAYIFRFVQAFVAPAQGIVGLVRDVNAHRLIHYCLKNFPVESFELLITEIECNWIALAKDKTGCFILQQCVDKSVGIHKHRLLSNIIAHAADLAQDPYGNSVVEHVLQLDDELGLHIVKQLRGSFASLSFDKFACHLVKKCLMLTDQANLIISELLEFSSFPRLIFDPFGSSVIILALSVSKVTEFNLNEQLKTQVTSVLEAKKDDINCLDVIEEFARHM